jgi:hypothetical protein
MAGKALPRWTRTGRFLAFAYRALKIAPFRKNVAVMAARGDIGRD